MAYIFTAKEFVERLFKAMNTAEQTYCNSCFGSNLTYPEMIDQYTTETLWDRTHAAETTAKAKAAKAAGKPLFGWDCVNLPKGILWGWTGDSTTPRAGAVYQSNGVPDTTIEAIYKDYCREQSTDWSNVEIGEFCVYTEKYGHCGVYVGDGMMIEATTKWDGKIQLSQVQNMIDNGKYVKISDKVRKWWAHGKLVWIDYTENNNVTTDAHICCPYCGREILLTLSTEVQYRRYVVKDGDNVCKIAREQLGNESRYKEILTINHMSENDYIYTGELLLLPYK